MDTMLATNVAARLYENLVNAETNLRWDEIENHFAAMPARYWPRVNDATLRWHLDILHHFHDGLTRSDAAASPITVRWRHVAERGISEVVVCAWDRLGLLAQIAGSFAAAGLNIVRADVYTRADNVALDVFQVCDEEGQHVRDVSRLKQMEQLLTAGDTAWQTWMDRVGETGEQLQTPVVAFEGDGPEAYSVLKVETADRVGLLHDILKALSACDVDIAHAIVVTEGNEAADVFFFTGTDGQKITDPIRLGNIRDAVLSAIAWKGNLAALTYA